MMKKSVNKRQTKHIITVDQNNYNNSTDSSSDIDLLKLNINYIENHMKLSSTTLNDSRKTKLTEQKQRNLPTNSTSSPLINLVSRKHNSNNDENFSESTKKHRPLLKSIYTHWVPEIESFNVRSKIPLYRKSAPDSSVTKQFENFSQVKNQSEMSQKPRSARTFVNKGDDKVEEKQFPFTTTPSGNLKIGPNQVIFESKKLSVLVANPKDINKNDNTNDLAKTSHTSDRPPSKEFYKTMNQLSEELINSFSFNENGNHSDNNDDDDETNEAENLAPVLTPEIKLEQYGCFDAEPIDWSKIQLDTKTNLYEELARRINNYVLADCIVYIENEEFSCHLIVLQSYSKYFENVTEKKVDLRKQSYVSAKAFAAIYGWMTSSEGECYKFLTRENCLELVLAAKYLQIKELEKQCLTFISSQEVFNEDTAFTLFLDARRKGLNDIAELMIPRIRDFFFTLVSSQDWLELSLPDLCAFLSSNYILINCEMEVLMSAIRWLRYNWKSRQKYIAKLMKCIRFGLIEPWQLIDIKRNPENPEFIAIAQHPEVLKMIDDGLAFVIIKYWYGQSNEDFQHWLSLLDIEEPEPRNFSGVEKDYVTYRQFLEYLDSYRNDAIANKCGQKYGRLLKDFAANERLEKRERNSVTIDTEKQEALKNQTEEKPNISDKLKEIITHGPAEERPQLRSYDIYQATTNQEHVVNRKPCSCKEKSPLMPNEISASYLPVTNRNFFEEGTLFAADRETILVFGGIDPHSQYGIGRNTGKDVYRYQPEQNVWEFVTELPEPRHHHAVAFLKARVFLAGGADPRDDDLRGKASVVTTVWSFDPVHRSWFSESGLNIARKNLGLVTTKQNLYAIGGQDKTGRVLASVERYDLNNGVWEEVMPLNSPRMGVATTKYRGKIWVAGGMTGSKKHPLSCDCEYYDPRYNQWTAVTNLRFPRCFGRLFVMNDTLFLIGGAGRMSESDRTTSSVESIDVWNYKEKKWCLLTEMAIPRHGHAVAYIGTQILIIGGVTTVYMRALSNVECYCVERCTWIRGVAGLPTTLSGHGAVTLPPASLL